MFGSRLAPRQHDVGAVGELPLQPTGGGPRERRTETAHLVFGSLLVAADLELAGAVDAASFAGRQAMELFDFAPFLAASNQMRLVLLDVIAPPAPCQMGPSRALRLVVPSVLMVPSAQRRWLLPLHLSSHRIESHQTLLEWAVVSISDHAAVAWEARSSLARNPDWRTSFLESLPIWNGAIPLQLFAGFFLCEIFSPASS